MVLSLLLKRKKYGMKNIVIFCLLLATVGCKTQKNHEKSKITDTLKTMLTAEIGKINAPSDAVVIKSVRVEGNKLFLDIQYSGGCEEHAFQFIGSPVIAKSLPPIRAVQLVHAANGDACKKLIEQTLEIDISALAYKKEIESKIFLNLQGWAERIAYTFE